MNTRTSRRCSFETDAPRPVNSCLVRSARTVNRINFWRPERAPTFRVPRDHDPSQTHFYTPFYLLKNPKGLNVVHVISTLYLRVFSSPNVDARRQLTNGTAVDADNARITGTPTYVRRRFWADQYGLNIFGSPFPSKWTTTYLSSCFKTVRHSHGIRKYAKFCVFSTDGRPAVRRTKVIAKHNYFISN